MAKVPLDGLVIEVEHDSPPEEVGAQLAAFAEDLAENRFSDWGVTVERREGGGLALAGGKDGTAFQAEVEAFPGRAVATLAGHIELGRLTLTLAGGADGVRRRVTDTIAQSLRDHLR